MKNTYVLLLLLNSCAFSELQQMHNTRIEGIYDVTKITFDKQEIQSSQYQQMVVIALDSDRKGILTFNTNNVSVTSISTISTACEFILNGNQYDIYDLEKKTIIGIILDKQLYLFEKKKNYESELFATKSLDVN